jgi:hypothetical protein
MFIHMKMVYYTILKYEESQTQNDLPKSACICSYMCLSHDPQTCPCTHKEIEFITKSEVRQSSQNCKDVGSRTMYKFGPFLLQRQTMNSQTKQRYATVYTSCIKHNIKQKNRENTRAKERSKAYELERSQKGKQQTLSYLLIKPPGLPAVFNLNSNSTLVV